MALTTGTIFEIRATATTGNVNGAGFNSANANFPTDATTDSNTANTASPVLSSATYNFVAGDVGAWIYIKSGTNWTPGFYQIASVASNKATLNAAIGAGLQLNAATGMYVPNTVVGVATVGTPTGGTYGVDYSQQDTAKTTATDFTSVGSSTTMTSATAAFTPVMVGNFYHQTTTGTGAFGVVGWYEIVSYTNATTIVLDRTPNSGTASVACTGFVGGAGRLNALEDAFYEMIPAASMIWIKSGTYTLSATINISSTNSTITQPSMSQGYTSLRGDTCNGTSRPVLAAGANSITWGQYQQFANISVTGTASQLVSTVAGGVHRNCKIFNSSTTASRTALASGTINYVYSCETISQNGIAMSNATGGIVAVGNYLHDSVTGFSSTVAGAKFSGNIVAFNSSTCFTANTSNHFLNGNTFYGTEAKIGTGVSLTTANSSNNVVFSNIFYGLATGISVNTGPAGSNLSYSNDFFNNTTDATNWLKSPADMAINPSFTNVAQINGTTATTSGSTLTDGSANFSTVTDNVSFVRVVSGTGVTVANYLITGHTSTTLTTNNALGTSSAGDVVYVVTTTTNFGVGAALVSQGFPTLVNTGTSSQGYPVPGAVQRSSAGSAHAFVS